MNRSSCSCDYTPRHQHTVLRGWTPPVSNNIQQGNACILSSSSPLHLFCSLPSAVCFSPLLINQLISILQLYSQFTEEQLNGERGFFLSWNDVPTEEHKAAMTSYIDQFPHQGQSDKKYAPLCSFSSLVIRTVFRSFFHLLVHPPSFISHSLTHRCRRRCYQPRDAQCFQSKLWQAQVKSNFWREKIQAKSWRGGVNSGSTQ